MKKIKTFMAGIIVGVIIASSVTVFAESVIIQAYRNQTKITLDGKGLVLPSDTSVLNYNDRTYTPARFIAESLGATVDWDAENDTVKITSPEPVVIEKEVIKEVPVEKKEETPATRDYMKLPVRYATKDYYVDVYGASLFTSSAEFRLTIKNESDRDIAIYLLYQDAYVLSGDKKVYADRINSDWYNSISMDSTVDGTLSFPAVPKENEKITLVLPIEIKDYSKNTTEKKEITFYIDTYEEEK